MNIICSKNTGSLSIEKKKTEIEKVTIKPCYDY